MRELGQAVLVGEHLAQVGDVGGGLGRGQVGARNGLGLREPALQPDDQGEVLPHAGIDAAAGNLLQPTLSAIDRAISKGVLHENTGNRYKSRLALAHNGLKANAAK